MKTPDLPVVHWRKSTHSGAEGGDCVEVVLLPAQSTLKQRPPK